MLNRKGVRRFSSRASAWRHWLWVSSGTGFSRSLTFLPAGIKPTALVWPCAWMPANAAYPAQLAEELYAIDPPAAKSLLQKAVKLNRYDASSWIQLGLLSEAENDLPQAEESLLEAARVDSTFLPSWSLTNFYFRRENAARFWYWAQRAAQMVPDDATPLVPPGLVRRSQCPGD